MNSSLHVLQWTTTFTQYHIYETTTISSLARRRQEIHNFFKKNYELTSSSFTQLLFIAIQRLIGVGYRDVYLPHQSSALIKIIHVSLNKKGNKIILSHLAKKQIILSLSVNPSSMYISF